MTVPTPDYTKQVDKLLNKADNDLIRFAHVIRGWGGSFSDAVADSLSLIRLKGDVFCRSLTHIHSPREGRVEVRNVYRPGYEGTDITNIEPYVSLELFKAHVGDSSRVAYGDALKRLQEHLTTLYGEVSKISAPAFDVIRYLTKRDWWVCTYSYESNGATIQLTNGVDSATVRINYTPMGLDKRAIAEYLKRRKEH